MIPTDMFNSKLYGFDYNMDNDVIGISNITDTSFTLVKVVTAVDGMSYFALRLY